MVTVNDTIAQGKAWLRTQLDKGAQCPLCHQRAQIYKRPINGAATRGLIEVYISHGQDWVHIPSLPGMSKLGGEWSRLANWGLIEEAKEKRADGGRAGWWRITDLGALFVTDKAKIPSHFLTYDNKFQGFHGMPIGVKEALGNKFSYEELMKGI